MPRKGVNVARSNHQPVAVPPHMKSQLAHGISGARKTVLAPPKSERDEDDMDVEEEDVGAEDDGEEDNGSVAEMLTILQEFQKRKANKTSARAVAFQNEKAALFSGARKKADVVVKGGIGSIEKARNIITELKAKETSQDGAINKLRMFSEHQDECMQNILGHLTGVIEDLSHRRAAQINESSAMIENQTNARERSRKRVLKFANSRISDSLQNQKVVSDATALIKSYKALLSSR